MTYRVDRINPFSALIALPFNPVSIEIREQPIDIVRAGRVTIPFCSIVAQECFILERVRLLGQIASMDGQARSN